MIDDTDVAIITSGEALARLARLMPAPAQQHLWRLPLVVPSQRVVEQAVRLGFLSTPKVPEQVSDAAYLHCLDNCKAETQPGGLTKPKSRPPPPQSGRPRVRTQVLLRHLVSVFRLAKKQKLNRHIST